MEIPAAVDKKNSKEVQMTAQELDTLSPILFKAIVAAETCLARLEMMPIEEHANMSREAYRDYMREEYATTDRGNW